MWPWQTWALHVDPQVQWLWVAWQRVQGTAGAAWGLALPARAPQPHAELVTGLIPGSAATQLSWRQWVVPEFPWHRAQFWPLPCTPLVHQSPTHTPDLLQPPQWGPTATKQCWVPQPPT